ncbi:MAG: class I SAM-dependent rRNA methyltransferase [Saprospiraceae bacterium]
MVKITLKPGKEEFVRRFHPWIFSGAIAHLEGEPLDGDLVQVCSRRGEHLAVGHFHHGSIAVRILSFETENPSDAAFWVRKFERAFAVRRALGLIGDLDTSCYRLAHGEGDGLSGLVVDVYGDVAVLQCHSIGMHRQRDVLAAALKSVLGKHIAVFDKSAEALPPKYAQSIQNQFIGTPGPSTVEVSENGVRFKVDIASGQKTGFFLDQRDNRLLLTKFVRGKSVLNTFCYTGGFSAYALAAGAREVCSVDVSQRAMDLTAENVALNAPFDGSHEVQCTDVQQFLKNDDRLWDVLVVDPPAFAKSLDKRHNAVQGYKRLNEAAIRRTAPGGVVFTFSCSQVVDRQLFYDTIVAAAMEAGRQVRVLHHLTQGGDHPVNIFHPEGAYLKGLVLFVE